MRPTYCGSNSKSHSNYFTPATDHIAERLAVNSTALTKWQLFQSITSGSEIIINGLPCTVQSIKKEDGSGSSFLLTVQYKGSNYPSYSRTND
jgi:hypothetical protein